jgi:hypothetical protein
MKHSCTNAKPSHGLLALTIAIGVFVVIGGALFWSLSVS